MFFIPLCKPDAQFVYPKYHILEHYIDQIEQFGSLLNGDTETAEGLHPMIKRAYKNCNKKGAFYANDTEDSANVYMVYYR